MRYLLTFVLTLLSVTQVYANSFEKGSQAYQAGKYRESIAAFRQAVNEDDRPVFAWFNMGHSLVQLKKYHLAIVAYNRAIELQPTWSPPYRLLGDLFYTLEVYPEALAYYRHAEELGESGKYLSLAQAEAAFKIGAYTESLKKFEEALKFDPEDVQIYYAITEVYELEKDYASARATLEDALRLAPASGADLYFYLASLYQSEGKLKESISSLESGLALDYKRYNMRRLLASKYLEAKKPWMAVFILEEGLERGGPASLAIDLADIFIRQQRYEEALDVYKIAHKKKDYRARRGIKNIASFYHNSGNEVRSEQILDWLNQR